MGGVLQSHIRSRLLSRHGFAVVLAWACLNSVWKPDRLQASPVDWQSRIRQMVQQRELTNALVIAEDRLGEHPEDLEARGWRARLLAWTNRWNESEVEYQAVLQSAPHDTDILVGLADLLIWQGLQTEAIALLDQASAIDPSRNDVQLRRGRLLHALGRRAEAGAAYALVLSLRGLFVGTEDGLATSATAFLHQGYQSQRLSSLGRVAGLFQPVWQGRLQPTSTLGMKKQIHGRVGYARTRWDGGNPGQSNVKEFRLGGHAQAANGMNYAIRF